MDAFSAGVRLRDEIAGMTLPHDQFRWTGPPKTTSMLQGATAQTKRRPRWSHHGLGHGRPGCSPARGPESRWLFSSPEDRMPFMFRRSTPTAASRSAFAEDHPSGGLLPPVVAAVIRHQHVR